MKTNLAAFNADGIKEFSDFVQDKIANGGAQSVDPELLLSNKYQGPTKELIELEQREFESFFELFEYLDQVEGFSKTVDFLEENEDLKGLFTWLTAFFWANFEHSTLEGDKRSRRLRTSRPYTEPGRYVMEEEGSTFGAYKHTIYGPWKFYKKQKALGHTDLNKKIFHNLGGIQAVPYIWGQALEQTIGNEIIRNANYIAKSCFDHIVIDPEKGKTYSEIFKHGDVDGSIARLSTLINQFKRTYDFDESSAGFMFEVIGGIYKERYEKSVNYKKS